MLGIEPRVRVVAEHVSTVPGLPAGHERIALLQRRLGDVLPRAALPVRGRSAAGVV